MKFLKGNPIYSIITGSCPTCHNESMYSNSNPYKLSTVITMNERCSHCNTKYQMEPSFFYGAMYVSYGLGVGIAVAAFMFAHYILLLNLLESFLFIVATILLLFPFLLRLSRNIWINLFLSYDKEKDKKIIPQSE